MYAVVRTGGKQVRVSPGQAVWIEKLDGQVGDTVELDEVLLVGGDGETHVGAPRVDGAKVVGTITAHGRGEKIVSTAADYCSYRPDADNSTLTTERLVAATLRCLGGHGRARKAAGTRTGD